MTSIARQGDRCPSIATSMQRAPSSRSAGIPGCSQGPTVLSFRGTSRLMARGRATEKATPSRWGPPMSPSTPHGWTIPPRACRIMRRSRHNRLHALLPRRRRAGGHHEGEPRLRPRHRRHGHQRTAVDESRSPRCVQPGLRLLSFGRCHADANVSSHDCGFCHTQAGASSVPGITGKEWAQAAFHIHFPLAAPLDITSGRCSNCHLNLKPVPGYTTFNHAP
jgi:hypothetical protein